MQGRLLIFRVLGALILATVTGAVLLSYPLHVPGANPAIPADAAQTLTRIQTNLDRLAQGKSLRKRPADEAGDPLEAIVDTYALYLQGNHKGMDRLLGQIDAIAFARTTDSRLRDLNTRLIGAPPLARLAGGLRKVELVLAVEGQKLLLPCPTLRHHEAETAEAGRWLNVHAGPLSSCSAKQ